MLFEIISTPHGSSPTWVRDGWVGIQFQPLDSHPVTVQTRAAGTSGGVLAQIMAAAQGKPEIEERRGYPANARDLLGLLALHNEESAKWYIDNAPQMLDPQQVFILDEACCVAVTD
ncbi:hypothetical protein [uncultured Sulfitobacter sp.]|uniref:hypothetical protein n=1 Tax=uncultured Sulfitobacter sp. TaxID=191468 RepID=UPI00263249EE|nr:hypothetical protein [uncultured Sulfitobacter sp.]